MKNLKKIVMLAAMVGIVGTTGAVYAATAKTPAEIVSGLTGKTVEQLTGERATGKTYGTIANEAGKLDEFKSQMLEQKKAILDERVKAGTLTQTQADEIYNSIKANQENCTGTGNGRAGMKNGAGGCGIGSGRGMGNGAGMGFGRGMNR